MDNKINLEYVKRIKKGNLQAFEELVNYTTPLVMSVCLSCMKNVYDAEDACQETFLKLWRSIESFRGDSALTTFLYVIAKNTCFDMLSKRQKNTHEALDDSLSDRENTPENEYIKHELRTAVFSAIAELDESSREVLLLREKAGLSYAEISETLSVSEGTVKSRISRAREKLLKKLDEKTYFNGTILSLFRQILQRR